MKKQLVKYFDSRINSFIIILILASIIIKGLFIDKGFFSLQDEFRYIFSEKALQSIKEFKIGLTLDYLFSVPGKPFDVFIKMLPHIIQDIQSSITDTYKYSSQGFTSLFVFNLIIYLSILITHYKMSNYLFKSRSYALISVLLFSSITNSYLYINHILPYDLSLLIIYSILTYIVINFNHLNKFKHLVIGILSFLGFITYPGYLPFLMIIGFYILFNKIKHQVYNNCFNALFFIIGLIIALVFTQILSIIGGHNYIIDSMNFSETITFGSYEESYSFIFKYLFEVEKIVGSIIVMLLAFHIYLVIKIKPEINSYYVLIIGVLSIYLFYASLGFFFHRFVQYGRLIHQYIPFVVVISIYSITKINIPKKTTFLLVLSSFIFIGYFYNFISLYKMGYPRDIAWKYSKKYDFNNIIINNEFMNILPNYPLKQYPFEEIGRYTEFTFPHTSKDSIVLVNFCHIFPPKNKEEISLYISNNYKEIVNTKHFLSHIAYQFEGANIDQRKKVQKFSQFYKIKLYAK